MDRLKPPGWTKATRWLKRRMPTGLYTRSVLIVIIPMLLLQSVVSAVFMERHWRNVTERLSQAVTRDIAAIIEIIKTYPPANGDYTEITRIARDQLSLNISVLPDTQLPPPRPKPLRMERSNYGHRRQKTAMPV